LDVELGHDHPFANGDAFVAVGAAHISLRSIVCEAPDGEIRLVENARDENERITFEVVRDNGPRMIVRRHTQHRLAQARQSALHTTPESARSKRTSTPSLFS
jgi:hypothetical protein